MKSALIICLKELKESLREFHVLVLSLGFPLLFYPLILLGAIQLQSLEEGRLLQDPPRIAVDGPEDLRVAVQETNLRLVDMPADGDIGRAIQEGELDLAVLSRTEGKSLQLSVVLDGSSPRSKASHQLLEPLLAPLRDGRRTDLEASLGIPEGDLAPFEIEEIDTATEGQKMAMLVSMLVPLLMLMCMVMAGIYPAVELITGERVRGTLETTMSAPVSRGSIVAGKILAVVSLMLLAVLANGFSMGLTLFHMMALMSDTPPSLTLDWLALLGAFPLVMSTVVLTATVLVLAALPVQSFKAGQNAVSTIALFALLPCMIGVVPGLEFGPVWAAIPLSNTALVLRDVLNGEGLHSLTWLSLILNSSLAILGLWFASRIVRSEQFLFGPSTGGLTRWRLILGRLGGRI